MDRQMLPHALNGGYIEAYEFDMRRNLVTMRIDILERGTLTSHNIHFEKTSRFAFDTESMTGSDNRLELTELWVDVAPESSDSEEWSVTISIWDITHVRLRCSVITIDGEVLR